MGAGASAETRVCKEDALAKIEAAFGDEDCCTRTIREICNAGAPSPGKPQTPGDYRSILGKPDPAIAAKEAPKRVAALRALRVFRDLYRRALELWRKHPYPVVFPYGTFKMRNHPGVLIAAPPPQAFAA